MKISGAVAVVFGGSGLLGREAARHLGTLGASVIVADAVAPREDAGVDFVKCDALDSADVRVALARARRIGEIRIVLDCIGAAIVRRTLSRDGEPHDLDAFRRMLEVNVVAPFNVLRLAAKEMASNTPMEDGERGVVINVSSLAGLEGSTGQVAYGAAKAAVAGMTLPAARDLGVVGVRVLAIAPGAMGVTDVDLDPVQQALVDATPFPRRLGSPHDFAHLVEALITNVYLNGQVVRLDGGLRLGLKS